MPVLPRGRAKRNRWYQYRCVLRHWECATPSGMASVRCFTLFLHVATYGLYRLQYMTLNRLRLRFFEFIIYSRVTETLHNCDSWHPGLYATTRHQTYSLYSDTVPPYKMPNRIEGIESFYSNPIRIIRCM